MNNSDINLIFHNHDESKIMDFLKNNKDLHNKKGDGEKTRAFFSTLKSSFPTHLKFHPRCLRIFLRTLGRAGSGKSKSKESGNKRGQSEREEIILFDG